MESPSKLIKKGTSAQALRMETKSWSDRQVACLDAISAPRQEGLSRKLTIGQFLIPSEYSQVLNLLIVALWI